MVLRTTRPASDQEEVPNMPEPPSFPSIQQMEMTLKSMDSIKRGEHFFEMARLPGLPRVRNLLASSRGRSKNSLGMLRAVKQQLLSV